MASGERIESRTANQLRFIKHIKELLYSFVANNQQKKKKKEVASMRTFIIVSYVKCSKEVVEYWQFYGTNIDNYTHILLNLMKHTTQYHPSHPLNFLHSLSLFTVIIPLSARSSTECMLGIGGWILCASIGCKCGL